MILVSRRDSPIETIELSPEDSIPDIVFSYADQLRRNVAVRVLHSRGAQTFAVPNADIEALAYALLEMIGKR